MEQTRNKNGKFAKQYRFETRSEYEKELRRVELKLEDQADKLKENERDIKSQASLIATLQKNSEKDVQVNRLLLNTNHRLFNVISFAKKFPITRLAIWLKYGE